MIIKNGGWTECPYKTSNYPDSYFVDFKELQQIFFFVLTYSLLSLRHKPPHKQKDL